MALDLNSVVTRIVEQGGNVEASAFTAEEIQALGSNPDVSLYGANYEAVRAGMEKLGIDGDAKEAVLFAVLANEAIAGRVGEGDRLGGIPMVGMGKISFPG